MAPAGTPIAVIDKINSAINESLRSAEVTATLGRLGFQTKVTTPKEFSIFLSAEMQKWPARLRSAGVQPE
jgi:tripartite-type tricarboxylate transporter receptor subunit TctC